MLLAAFGCLCTLSWYVAAVSLAMAAMIWLGSLVLRSPEEQERGRATWFMLGMCAAAAAAGMIRRDAALFEAAASTLWFWGVFVALAPRFAQRHADAFFGALCASVLCSACVCLSVTLVLFLVAFGAFSSAFVVAARLESLDPDDVVGAMPSRRAAAAAACLGASLLACAALAPALLPHGFSWARAKRRGNLRMRNVTLARGERIRLDRSPAMWVSTGTPSYLRGATFAVYSRGTWRHGYWLYRSAAPAPEAPKRTPQGAAVRAEVILNDTGTLSLFAPLRTTSAECESAEIARRPDGTFVLTENVRFPVGYRVSFAPTQGPPSEARARPPADSADSAPRPDATVNPALLELPFGVDRLRQLARTVTGGVSSASGKMAALEKLLLQQCRYGLNPRCAYRSRAGGPDPVEQFVFEAREGNCRHFASALALMARSVGIPARLASGFAPGEYSAATGRHVVRFADAHVWVEALIDGSWREFDATPPDFRISSPLGNWLRSRLDLLDFKLSVWGLGFHSFGGAIRRLAPQRRRWLLCAALMAAAVGLVTFLLSQRMYGSAAGETRRRLSVTAEGAAPGDYEQMLRILGVLGLARRGSDTPYDFLARVAAWRPELADSVRAVTEWFYLHRYSNRKIPQGTVAKVREALQRLQALAAPGND